MKKYLVLVTCFLSDLAIHCRAGSVVLLPADYTLPESKEGYPQKFKYLGEVDGTVNPKVDPELAEVESVLKEAKITKAVSDAYFREVGAETPEEKLKAAKELASDASPKEPVKRRAPAKKKA